MNEIFMLLIHKMYSKKYILILPSLCFGFLLLTGCSPTRFMLTNDDSFNKLNEMVKGKHVCVTTIDTVCDGDNLTIRPDSTALEYSTRTHMKIPYQNMKKIDYLPGAFTEGTIELKNNQRIKAQNIFIANYDTLIRFDEIDNYTKSFPTQDLKRIQIKDQLGSTVKGLAYGLSGGIVTGMILGVVLSPLVKQHFHSLNSGEIIAIGSGAGTVFGSIGGAIVGLIINDYEDINIIFKPEK
jgi:hypothetical protein